MGLGRSGQRPLASGVWEVGAGGSNDRAGRWVAAPAAGVRGQIEKGPFQQIPQWLLGAGGSGGALSEDTAVVRMATRLTGTV